MNRDSILDRIKNIIDSCFGYNFVFLQSFIDDLVNLLLNDANGDESSVLRIITKQLFFLKNLGRKINQADSNEYLKHVEELDLYSIHVKNRTVNFRFLITFHKDEAIFLSAFNEKSGKKKTSYQPFIELAINRYNSYLENGDGGDVKQ